MFIALNITAQSRVFENTAGNYKITIPENWKERVDSTTTDIFAPDKGKYDVWMEFVGVSLSQSKGLALDETFDYYMTIDFPGYYANFKIIKQGEEMVNGLKHKWVLYSFTNSTKKKATTLYNLFYLTLKNDTLYSLNAIAQKREYRSHEVTFLFIIRSFQVNP